jgi:aminopeptidase N
MRSARITLIVLGAALAGNAIPVAAQKPAPAARPRSARRTGVIGSYTPPRDWPLRQHDFDLQHQRIAVTLDMAHRMVIGRVTTRLVLTGAPTARVRLDAGNLTIDSAIARNGRPLAFAFDTTQVTVTLPRAAARGDTVEFTLAYHTIPERGIYFVPRRGIIWSQGEATETRNWIPTYDAANDKTTWEFLVTADSGQKVLSNGRLVEVTPAGNGKQVWHWSQDAPASTYLYSVVEGPLTILKDQWRGRPVEYWVSPDTVAAVWRTFGETPAMIELYSQLTGVPFPWAKYDQSVIPDFTYGGMENVSATTQTDLVLHPAGSEPQSGGRGLDAHELAHQWFGDLTTTANWAHIWLNEGLTTYMESVQNEKTRGWAAGQHSWYDQQQQAMAADENGHERPLVWGEYQGDDPIVLFFSGHVYPKGAQLAHQLRRLLGDSLFWAGMHRFLVDNAHKPVTTADYAAAFEKVAHRDLDWFFDQWAYGIGYPKLQVSRRWDRAARRLDVTVEQTQTIDSTHPVFRFPITVRIATRDSVVRREITVSKVKQTFAIPLPGNPLTFRFDEGGWLLGKVTTDQTTSELADLAEHDLDWAARNWALHALAGSTDSVADAARWLIVRNEHEPSLRALAAEQLGTRPSATTLEVLRSALRDPASEVRAAAIRALGIVDSAGVATTARTMFETDPNNTARLAGVMTYATVAGDAALPSLLEAAAKGRTLGTRATVASELAKSHDPRAAAALEAYTSADEPRNLRIIGLVSLLQQGDTARASSVATRYITDPDPLFAVQAVRALAKVGGDPGRAALEKAAAVETRGTVLAAIRQALGTGASD